LRELESMTLNQLLVAIATNVVKQKGKNPKKSSGPGKSAPSSTSSSSSISKVDSDTVSGPACTWDPNNPNSYK